MCLVSNHHCVIINLYYLTNKSGDDVDECVSIFNNGAKSVLDPVEVFCFLRAMFMVGGRNNDDGQQKIIFRNLD